jgi:hypothetical protein
MSGTKSSVSSTVFDISKAKRSDRARNTTQCVRFLISSFNNELRPSPYSRHSAKPSSLPICKKGQQNLRFSEAQMIRFTSEAAVSPFLGLTLS